MQYQFLMDLLEKLFSSGIKLKKMKYNWENIFYLKVQKDLLSYLE